MPVVTMSACPSAMSLPAFSSYGRALQRDSGPPAENAPGKRHNRVVSQSGAWVKTEHSRALSGRPSKNTAPEVLLRKALHAAGGRFRLHRRLAKGCTPDLVLPGRRIAVFVDGDYWHGCPVHFPNRKPSGPNAALWQAKFEATKARDERSTRMAEDAGWRVVRTWECEVRADPASVAARILCMPQSNVGSTTR